MTDSLCELGCNEVEALRPLLAEYPYLFDGQYLGEVPHRFLEDAFLRRSKEELSQGKQYSVTWKEGTEILGLANVQHLGWDSQHFGVPMVRLELMAGAKLEISFALELIRAAIRICSDRGIVHVSCRIHLGAPKALEALASCGFCPVGVKLTLRAMPGDIKSMDPIPDVRLRDFEPRDAARVRELAGSAVTDSRFHRDGRFAPRLVGALYEDWVERTIGRESSHIMVAQRGNEVVGFLASDIGIPVYGLKQEDLGGVQTGFVGLVVVDICARGSGIAKQLISEGTDRLFRRGCDVVYANVMLSNEPSVNAFFRTGFGLKGSVQELHLWL